MAMISIDRVTIAFGRTVALRDLSLELPPGITGVFGPNGAGKTTLLRAIAGLVRTTSGEITIHGAPVDLGNENLRRAIGYAGHKTGLYPHLTTRENLELFAHMYGAPRSRIEELAAAVGIEHRLDDRVGSLSAGFKQRAATVRALLHDPAILLLDEPYANLDDESAEAVSRTLVGWRRADRIALVATHGAKRVKAFADGSLILQHGGAVSHRVRVPDEVAT